MKPLIVLFIVFAISMIVTKLGSGRYKIGLSGRISMSAMLVFTAIGHFAFSKGMSLMIPEFIPFRTEIVYITGVLEIIFAVGILIPKYQKLVAWSLIIFLILILPANIYASINQIDYQKATFGGNGLSYLWFRIPLQILFIVWTYLSAIKYDSERSIIKNS